MNIDKFGTPKWKDWRIFKILMQQAKEEDFSADHKNDRSRKRQIDLMRDRVMNSLFRVFFSLRNIDKLKLL